MIDIQCFDKFEYKCLQFRGYTITQISSKLNELGKEGWELTHTGVKDYWDNEFYIFKRKIMQTKI